MQCKVDGLVVPECVDAGHNGRPGLRKTTESCLRVKEEKDEGKKDVVVDGG